MNLGKKQLQWVYQHGGRGFHDVFIEKGRMGIYLWSPRFPKFVCIPSEKRLRVRVIEDRSGNIKRELVREK